MDHMNCIDAIEGIIKCIVDRTLEDLAADMLDDTEYIRMTKTAIIAVLAFLDDNKEVSDNPDVIRQVLYDYAKEKWINQCADIHEKNKPTTTDGEDSMVDREYLDYYYDYIYDRGVYPP